MDNETPPERPGMVDWYSPSQLIQTGARTLMSTLLGEMIDSRRILAVEGAPEDCVVADYAQRDAFTFDYFADTGDGWDSTYTMAYLATLPALEVAGAGTLERADALLLGGDQVYPVASKKAYAQRLVWPFNQAARDVRRDTGLNRLPRKAVYLTPGNHDWYDSLGSLSRRFFAVKTGDELKRRDLGQFLTRQVRSYFVLELPHNWQIWGVDIQLGRDIDTGQFRFFADHAQTIGPETKIVLVVAEPTIVYGESAEIAKPSLVFGLERIRGLAHGRGARVMVQLAGDTHNYQHYTVEKETKDKTPYTRHQLVSGGGGAFLHPNHSFHRGSEDSPRIEPLARYPDRETSQKLAARIPLFTFAHPGMSALIGGLYLLMFWSTGSRFPIPSFPLDHPGSTLLMAVAVFGCAAFAGGRKLWGALHGVAHVLAAWLCWRIAENVADGLIDTGAALWSNPVWTLGYLPRILVFLLGMLIGGTLFGLYLWASLKFLRIHHNEAFSALGSPHYKSFLRCTVEDDGSLTIRVIGVDETAGADARHPVATRLVETISVGL